MTCFVFLLDERSYIQGVSRKRSDEENVKRIDRLALTGGTAGPFTRVIACEIQSNAEIALVDSKRMTWKSNNSLPFPTCNVNTD